MSVSTSLGQQEMRACKKEADEYKGRRGFHVLRALRFRLFAF
jgi:hypothetical protein